MKAQFLFFLIISAIFSSCSQSTERTLLGKWSAADRGFYIRNSIFVSDTLDASEYGTMTFRENGGGSFVHDDLKEEIEWAVNNEEVTLTIGEGTPRVYSILLDASQYQTWEYEKADSNITNGISSKEEWKSLLKLTKLKSDF